MDAVAFLLDQELLLCHSQSVRYGCRLAIHDIFDHILGLEHVLAVALVLCFILPQGGPDGTVDFLPAIRQSLNLKENAPKNNPRPRPSLYCLCHRGDRARF